MGANIETKRVTIPVSLDLKNKLDRIGDKQKRNLTATLEFALEVYAALHENDGTMRCSIDNILLGKLPVFQDENNQNCNSSVSTVESQPTNIIFEPLM